MHIATSGSKIDISKESLTAKIAKKFSKVLKHGDIVFLYGDIGAGKTTFVRYLINSLEKEKKIKLFPPIMGPNPFFRITFNHFFKPKIQFLGNFF